MTTNTRKGKTLLEAKPGIAPYLINPADGELLAGSNKKITVRCGFEGCTDPLVRVTNELSRSPMPVPMHSKCVFKERAKTSKTLIQAKPGYGPYLINPADGNLSVGSSRKIAVKCAFKGCLNMNAIVGRVPQFYNSRLSVPMHSKCAVIFTNQERAKASKTLIQTKPGYGPYLANPTDGNLPSGSRTKIAVKCAFNGCLNTNAIVGCVSKFSNSNTLLPMHKECSMYFRYGTTPMPVKTEMVREFVQAGTTDLDLHLLMSGLRLKGDVDKIKTKVRQGLPTGALADDLAETADTNEDTAPDLSEDDAATLVNDSDEDRAEDRPAELPASKIENMMKGMDQIEATLKKASDLDQERLRPIVESIVTVRVNMFWQELFDAEYEGQKIAPIVGKVRKLKPSSAIAKQAQDQFLAEYEVVSKVKAPAVYQGPPLRLMQRRIMFLAATRERLGNWSGTGSGKTIAALCSAVHTHSALTVVICPNPVKDTWAREIKNAFGDEVSFAAPDSDENWAKISRGVQILILNYECFQQTYSKAKITALLKGRGQDIGLFVLDECHYAKFNEEGEDESQRRKNIISFMGGAPTAKRLAMSATPVVNNLSEAKHLIEMLTGEDTDLKTRSTIRNCIAMFQQLVKYGIRWKPTYWEIKVCEPKVVPGTRYDSTAGKFNITGAIEIDAGPDLYDELVAEKTEKRRSFHTADVDRLTLPAKLDAIVQSVGKREKAIVYTEYRDGITDVLLNTFRAEGHKVALFDGSVSDEDRNKTLCAFRLPAGSPKAVNVIVATSAITTGIDGLQHCQKLIMASLPFTHARYEQLRGRVVRPTLDKTQRTVTILCPIVRTNGWSSDAVRLKRIESKKDIASSAVDGTVPKFAGTSRSGLERSILKALDKNKE